MGSASCSTCGCRGSRRRGWWGAALAYSGASYQGVFRNPLAGPFLLGVASGAGLGAAIAIVSPLDSGAWGFGWVPVFAFAGGLGTVLLVYLLARTGGTVDSVTLILAGVALSAILSAATAFMLLTGGEGGAADLHVPVRRLQHGELGAPGVGAALPVAGGRRRRAARAPC